MHGQGHVPAGDGALLHACDVAQVGDFIREESPDDPPSRAPQTARNAAARSRWARLLARSLEVFPLQCPDCGAAIAGVWERKPPKRSTGSGIPMSVL